jgi:hypothetical protein
MPMAEGETQHRFQRGIELWHFHYNRNCHLGEGADLIAPRRPGVYNHNTFLVETWANLQNRRKNE